MAFSLPQIAHPSVRPAFWSPRARCLNTRTQVSRVAVHARQGNIQEYSARGRYQPRNLNVIRLPVGVSSTETGPLQAQLEVAVPDGAPPGPLVVFSAGFLLNGSLYRSYSQHLTSHGYTTVLYDLPEVQDDVITVQALGKIVDHCLIDPAVARSVDPSCVLLVGHSRGAKLSVLLAARDKRVKGLALLDPVDNSSMTPVGPAYPSSLAALRTLTSPPRNVPVLVVGAALNGDVVPKEANYRRFTEMCVGPLWELDLLGCSHLQFLDKQIGLFSMFSSPGPTPDTAVRAASQGAVLAWFENIARPLASGTSFDPQQAQQTLEQQATEFQRTAKLKSTLRGVSTAQAARNATSSSSSGRPRQSGATAGSTSSGMKQAGADSPSTPSGASSPNRPNLEPILESYAELMKRRASELKAMLRDRGIDSTGLLEKGELVSALLQGSGGSGGGAATVRPGSGGYAPPPNSSSGGAGRSSYTSATSSSQQAPPPPPPPPPPGYWRPQSWTQADSPSDRSTNGQADGGYSSYASGNAASTPPRPPPPPPPPPQGYRAYTQGETTSAQPPQSPPAPPPPFSQQSGSGGGEVAGFQALMRKRASELKAMLSERGLDSRDVTEKEELVRRLLQAGL